MCVDVRVKSPVKVDHGCIAAAHRTLDESMRSVLAVPLTLEGGSRVLRTH
jgi:hypothetical protein